MIKRHRITGTFSTQIKAEHYIADQHAADRAGKLFVDKGLLKNWTVEEIVNEYIKGHMGGEKDPAGHMTAIEKAHFYKFTLDKFTDDEVYEWKAEMEARGNSDATIKRRLNQLSAVCNYAIQRLKGRPLRNWVNPASAIHVVRPRGSDVPRERVLVGDEYERLMEALAKSRYPDDLRLTKFCIEQATRLSEAVNLCWGDINFKTKIMSLKHTKTDKNRGTKGQRRSMASGSIAILKEKLATYEDPPKPTDRVFKVGTAKAFSVRFGRIKNDLKFEDFRFHDLKHVATTNLAKKIDFHKLRFVTGHTNTKMLSRYVNPDLTEIANEL